MQVVRYRDMSIRNDAQLREVLKRSNVIINLLGLAKETPNYSFEDVHIDAARRIATLAAESGVAERLIHLSCLGASEKSSSRRLRTKVSCSCCHAELPRLLVDPMTLAQATHGSLQHSSIARDQL